MTQIKQVVVTYRNNELYERRIGIVNDTLRDLGFEVESLVFPSQTIDGDVWRRVKEMDFRDALLVSDNTILNAAFSQLAKERLPNNKIKLDNIFDSAYKKVVAFPERDVSYMPLDDLLFGLSTGNETATTQERLEEFKHGLGNIVRNILINTSQPDRVYVIDERITDHTPFIWSEDSRPGYTRVEPQQAYETIKQGLVSAGIAEEKIELGARSTSKIFGYITGSGSNWVIGDRHGDCIKEAKVYRRGENKTFMVPLGNFIEDAKNTKLLTVDEEAIDKTISSMLTSRIASLNV